MRLIVAAVGRLKGGGERALFEKYRDRCDGAGKRLGIAPILWQEIAESRAELVCAPACSLARAGREENLQLGAGSDHRADVPPLGDPVARG